MATTTLKTKPKSLDQFCATRRPIEIADSYFGDGRKPKGYSYVEGWTIEDLGLGFTKGRYYVMTTEGEQFVGELADAEKILYESWVECTAPYSGTETRFAVEDTAFTKLQAGYRLTQLGIVAGRKVRATLYRDGYELQSYLKIELWAGTQWNEVITWEGERFHKVTSDIYSKPEAQRDDAIALIETAMIEAEWVLE